MIWFKPFRKNLCLFYSIFLIFFHNSCTKKSVSYNETILPLDQFVPFGNPVPWSKQVRTAMLPKTSPQKVTRLLRDRDDNIWLLRTAFLKGENAHYLGKYDEFGIPIFSLPFEKGTVPRDIAMGIGGEVTLVETRLLEPSLSNNPTPSHQIWLRRFSQIGAELRTVPLLSVPNKLPRYPVAENPSFKLLATPQGLYLAGTTQGLELTLLNSSLEVSWSQSVLPPEILDSSVKPFDFFLAGSQAGQVVVAHSIDAKHFSAWQKFVDKESFWQGGNSDIAVSVYSQSGDRFQSMLIGSALTDDVTGVGIYNDEIYLGGNFKESTQRGQNTQKESTSQVFFMRTNLFAEEPPLVKTIDLSPSNHSLSFQLDSRGRGVFTGTTWPLTAQSSDLNIEAEQGFAIRVDKEGEVQSKMQFEAPTAILDLAEKGDSEAYFGGFIFAKDNEGKTIMNALLGLLTWRPLQ